MRLVISTLVAAAATLGVSMPAAAQKVNAKQFGWHADYAAAKAEAKRTGKPLLVVFRCEP